MLWKPDQNISVIHTTNEYNITVKSLNKYVPNEFTETFSGVKYNSSSQAIL